MLSAVPRTILSATLVGLCLSALSACVTEPHLICQRDDGTEIVCSSGEECSANRDFCVPRNGCGNGVVNVENGEQCDDGNFVSGDGCSANCSSDETCGNGIADRHVGEQCDGEIGCEEDCTLAFCGELDDGQLDGEWTEPEVCDPTVPCDDCPGDPGSCDEECIDGDGTQESPCTRWRGSCLDGFMKCNALCTSKLECGNGVVDPEAAEQCDSGHELPDDDPLRQLQPSPLCDEECQPRTTNCGDGVIDGHLDEVCDQGSNNGDTAHTPFCSDDCRSDGACGNGIRDTVVPDGRNSEECDDGNRQDGDGCSSECILQCPGATADRPLVRCDDDGNPATPTICVDPMTDRQCCGAMAGDNGNACGAGQLCTDGACTTECGDGHVDQAAGEQCDDGNNTDADGCQGNCMLPGCGDGIVDPGEECDDGNNDNGDSCQANCLNPVCGDDIQGPGEQCDDGNTVDGDGCTSACITEFCGDGTDNDGDAEECDDGNTDNNDSCLDTCMNADCGDGHVWDQDGGTEQCDDGNMDNNDACVSCMNATCGDGYVRAGVESCDDGNDDDTDGCVSTCVVATCGDGFVRMDVEDCDDGAETATCNSDCTAHRCGDGVLNQAAGEQCDDGNMVDNDTCTNDCEVVLDIILEERFEASSMLDTVTWTASGSVSIDTSLPPGSSGYFANLPHSSAIEQASTWDTSMCSHIYWQYRVQDGSGTETTDRLLLEYHNGSTYVELDAATGNDMNPDFVIRTGLLSDADAKHAGFKIRVSNAADNPLGDESFNLDDLLILCQP